MQEYLVFSCTVTHLAFLSVAIHTTAEKTTRLFERKKKKRCEAPVFVKNTQINEQQYWKVDKIKHCELDEAVRYLCSVSQCSKMYQEGKH